MNKRFGNFTKEDLRMANRHTKTYSTTLVIRELQIKDTMRCHSILIGKSKIKKTLICQVSERMWGSWNPHSLLVGM